MLTDQEIIDATKPVLFVIRNEDGSIRSHGGTRPDEPCEAYYADDAGVVAELSTPRVPPSIRNWKAHAILKVDGKHQDVVAVINAIADPVKRELVMTAFERLDPLPRASATLVELLIAAGYDEAGIDQLFIRGNAIQIDPD